MAKIQIIISIIISSLMLIAEARIIAQKRGKEADFRVYIQEQLSEPNATSYEVARANITSTSPSSFGLVVVTDSIITAGPDPDSETLGRCQGLFIYSGLKESAVTISFNFVFTGGKYNGSTLGVSGWKLTSNINQELPLAGGTGVFRGVRGYTIGNTYSYNASTGHLVLIYDVYAVKKKNLNSIL